MVTKDTKKILDITAKQLFGCDYKKELKLNKHYMIPEEKQKLKDWLVNNLLTEDKGQVEIIINHVAHYFVDPFQSELAEKEKEIERLKVFARWASHNDWTYLPSKGKWYNEEEEERITPKTDDELYEIFKDKTL